MNKRIIVVSVLLLVLVVVFSACKKDTEYKVDYTVTLENGDVVEVYEDENGENFVTNADGDKIPVTSDADGFYDSIEDLITETTKSADKNDGSDKNNTSSKPADDKGGVKDEPSSNDKEPVSGGNSSEPSSSKEETSSEASSVQIGSDKNQDAVIDWNDIVAVP